jgi:hypothetical protein
MLATRLLIALAILALTTSALSAHEGMQLAQAGNESSAPAATPTPSSPAQTAAPEQKLVGLAAWNKLVGNSISGTEDGKLLIEYYAPDGAAKSMLGNEISTGTWMLVGEVICFKYADDDKPECYKLEVAGDTATMYDEKGSGTRYQILKGNPKGL